MERNFLPSLQAIVSDSEKHRLRQNHNHRGNNLMTEKQRGFAASALSVEHFFGLKSWLREATIDSAEPSAKMIMLSSTLVR